MQGSNPRAEILGDPKPETSGLRTKPDPKPKATPKAKTMSKTALDLVSKGALKLIDADSLYQQCIQNGVCLGWNRFKIQQTHREHYRLISVIELFRHVCNGVWNSPLRTSGYATAMIDDAKPAIQKLKDSLNELQHRVGKSDEAELSTYVGTCKQAFEMYDNQVANIKRAIAMNKPKKAKAPKGAAKPKAAPP